MSSQRTLSAIAALCDAALDPDCRLSAVDPFGGWPGANGLAHPEDGYGAGRQVALSGQDGSAAAMRKRDHVDGLHETAPSAPRTCYAGAMRLELRLRAAELRADHATDALNGLPQAVLLVAADGRVVFANAAADALLADADGLGIEQDRLRAAGTAHTATLRRLIAGAAGSTASGGTMRLDRPSPRRPLSVMVTPLRAAAQLAPAAIPAAAALVVMTDPDRAAAGPGRQTLRALFGLTGAEAALALLVGKGASVKESARTLGIAPSTARTHLHRIFAKTNTARQSELAVLLASVAIGAPW